MKDTNKEKCSYAIRVEKKLGFQTIENLKNRRLLDDSLEIVMNGKFLWVPVKKEIANSKEKTFSKKSPFPDLKKRFGIRAFDRIGEIIILYLPEELKINDSEVGEYLLKSYPGIKAVYREIGLREEEFRSQSLKLIAGKGAETIHKENGLKFKLDVTKAFFSPRQVTEREELLQYVNEGDKVCVFFSGIGPIPIYIAHFAIVKQIVGVELNSAAYNYALENISLNNVQGIKLFNGDVSEIASLLQKEKLFDLVVMPLPKQKENFITEAKSILDINGNLVIYQVGKERDKNDLVEELRKNGFEIVKSKKGAQVGPREWRYFVYARRID